MIANEQELHATQERIQYFEGVLEQMRVKARPEEFRFMANGYRDEIEKMHDEVLDFLTCHSSETIPTRRAESA